MAGYQPLKITGNATGLVQSREEFLLPDDAYPNLTNAYVWRERILRKGGYELLGRLQRNLTGQVLTTNYTAPSFTNNLITLFSLESTSQIVPGSLSISATKPMNNPYAFADFNADGNIITTLGGAYYEPILGITQATQAQITLGGGVFLAGQTVYIQGVTGMTQINNAYYTVVSFIGNVLTINVNSTTFSPYVSGGTVQYVAGSINYSTGSIVLNLNASFNTYTLTAAFGYYPCLPVMGIRIEELTNSATDRTIFFDQKYAYIYNQSINSFEEFLPLTMTTWNAAGEPVSGTSFFWSTNYWVSVNPTFTTPNLKLFWVTNNTGEFGAAADPPRITDGTTWVDFYDDTLPATNSPWAKIDATNWLVNWLSMLPYRGRMVTFNTWEGTSAGTATNFSNRIRWASVGNPFIPYAAGPPATGSWRDDIRGKGGFLDIPTSEDIISIGFVRDNLVVYCERSTWQLRYTGRTIAPFQIERVNSELGGEGPLSPVQFDTSLVGIGDKGIVECDSYKAERIDIKIPDYVFSFQTANNGPFRVHGIRDFISRLAYWTIPVLSQYDARIDPDDWIFPNMRLVYNYENDSWALFTDCLTALGTYQPQSNRTWLNTNLPWIECEFSWIDGPPAGIPAILGGNQQGFIEYLDSPNQTVNAPSLFISTIVGNTTTPTVITSPNHNLVTTTGGNNIPYVIQISGIPTGTPYANLNGGVFGISVIDPNTFSLYTYNSSTDQFSNGQLDVPSGTYVGGGLISLRENFFIQSKKFNFLDEGQNIQLGYLDILMQATEPNNPGAITLKVYLDYNDADASNTLPQNEINDYSDASVPDTFFNSVIPTTSSSLNTKGGSKFWQRVFCPTRANFLTLVYTFSNGQLNGEEQQQDVQIDAQVLFIRKAGRLTQI